MENKKNRFLALLLIVVMLLTSIFATTGCTKKTSKEPDKEPNAEVVTPEKPESIDGQKFSYLEDKWMVQDGVSDYVIVRQKSESSIYATAAEEFRKFFAESTGCILPIYVDGADIPNGKKLISLGQTSYAKAQSLTDKELEAEGFRIVSIDENIYIVGESGYGVQWGVYKLLNLLVGYEFFKEDCYALNGDVMNLNLCDVDWTEAPDIAYTPGYHGLCNYNTGTIALRYRNRGVSNIAGGAMTGDFHNSLVILDPKIYNDADKPKNYHPSWYATTNDQLCYTARGEEAELEAMVNTVADYFIDGLLAAPDAHYVLFQMMDTRSWCSCTACTELEAKYGAKSTSVLLMSKRLHDVLKQKLEKAGDDRDIYVVPMLYNAIEDVPVVKDKETGTYRLTDESLDFTGVVPLWAVMSAKVHAKAWQDGENAGAVEMLNKLNCAFDDIWLWDYGVNFLDYFVPYNLFDNMSEDFRFLKQYNIALYLYQLDHSGGNSSSFGGLKSYLLSKLMWDADLNVDVLTDNYFAHVYGDGAEEMRKLYDSWLNLWEYNSVQHGEVVAWDEGIYGAPLKAEYFPRGTVREWLNMIDRAYEAIAPLKETNQSQYAIYEYNIRMESIFVRYIYAVLYLTGNDESNIQYKMDLYQDVADNFYQVGENKGTWDFAVTLGIDHLLA